MGAPLHADNIVSNPSGTPFRIMNLVIYFDADLAAQRPVCWWQCAKGPFWQDHKDHSGTGCWSGNITRLAGWRASDLTYESYPCKEKSKSESSGPPRGACQNGPIFHCHRHPFS